MTEHSAESDQRPHPELPPSRFDLRVERSTVWLRDVASPWARRVQEWFDRKWWWPGFLKTPKHLHKRPGEEET